jgi:hypothetical protein
MTEPSLHLSNLQYTGPWIPLHRMPAALPKTISRPSTQGALPRKKVTDLLRDAFAAHGPDGDSAIVASSRNWLGIDVFALQPDGAARYHAGAQRLLPMHEMDLRGHGGAHEGTGAEVMFVYVADFSRTAPTSCDARSRAASGRANAIARSIQLHCGHLGLAATQHRIDDGRELALGLGLLDSQRIALVQALRRTVEATVERLRDGERFFRYGI